MSFNKEKVEAYLPHRDPFLFVDEILEISTPADKPQSGEYFSPKELNGGRVRGKFFVREDLDILRGHFPGRPILPGVIQVEMMAQAASFLLTKTFDDVKNIELEVALLGVDKCRFRRPIYPGMELILESTQKRCRGSILTYECSIFHHQQLMSGAEVMASVKIAPKSKE